MRNWKTKSPTRPRSKRVELRAIGLLLAALTPGMAAPATAEFEAGKFAVRTFEWNGLERRYYVYAPIGYDGSERELVLDIHGFGSDGAEHSGFSGFKNLADSAGFLVAWPDGFANAWNAGICCGTPQSQGIDDVGFIREVVARISEETAIDPTAIYATGLSNGGAMSHRLACEAADLFAAAAPIAFPVPFFPMTQCQPSRPIATAMVMGLTDAVVPYDSGFFPGATNSFDYWRETNACQGESPDQTTPLLGDAACETYATCEAGVETRLCSIVGSEANGFSGHVLYFNESGYDVASDSWDFMKRHTLPVPEPESVPVTVTALFVLALVFASSGAARARSNPPRARLPSPGALQPGPIEPSASERASLA